MNIRNVKLNCKTSLHKRMNITINFCNKTQLSRQTMRVYLKIKTKFSKRCSLPLNTFLGSRTSALKQTRLVSTF